MLTWLKSATALQRSLSLSVLTLLAVLVAFSLLARTRRARAALELSPVLATPTPLIPSTRAGIPPIDAAQPQETYTATFALG
jgi:hypothetical protein